MAEIKSIKLPNGTVYDLAMKQMSAATSGAAGSAGAVPAPAAGDHIKYLRGDGTWDMPPGAQYSTMTGATDQYNGAEGLVPAPAAGEQNDYLRGDGSWAEPVNDANETGSGKVLDARMGKTLNDKVDSLGANAATNVNLGFVYLNQADLAALCTYVTNNFHTGKPYSISTNVAIARILTGDNTNEIAVGVMEKQSAMVCKYVIGRPNSNTAFITGYFNPSDSTQAPVIHTAINKGGNGNAANVTVDSFTASTASYPVPAAGDTLKAAFGKIAKFFGDIKGAVTGLSISGKTITWTKANGTTGTLTTQDTTYTAGSGLSLSGTQFKHSNSVTAGTAGTSSATSAQNTLSVPYVTYDAQGHVTAVGTHTHTINGMAAATSSAAGKTGLVPQPAAGRNTYYLRGDATWQAPQNNLTTTGAGLVLDARQGKALNDKLTTATTGTGTLVNSSLDTSKTNIVNYVHYASLHLCMVQFDVHLKAGINTNGVAKIATGLPKSVLGGNSHVCTYSGQSSGIGQFLVDVSGVLWPWYFGTSIAGGHAFGCFTYITQT